MVQRIIFHAVFYNPPSLLACEGFLCLAPSLLLPILLPAVRIFCVFARICLIIEHINLQQSQFILEGTSCHSNNFCCFSMLGRVSAGFCEVHFLKSIGSDPAFH